MILIVTPRKLHQILLTNYVFPSVCGWNVVDLFNLVSIFSHNVVQNVRRNMVSLFEMMILCISNCIQTYSKKMCVASYSLMVFLQGMRMHIFQNLSTTTNKQSCPFLVFGKIPIKSMEMLSQGQVGIGNGWYRPCFLLLILIVQQSIHPLIYLATSSCILGLLSPTPRDN